MVKQAYSSKARSTQSWKESRLSSVKRERVHPWSQSLLMTKVPIGKPVIKKYLLEASWGASFPWGRWRFLQDLDRAISSICSLLFSVGPLHSDLEYTVSSQKEGYVLTAVEGTIGDFKAYALAGVSFEVTLHVFKKHFIGVWLTYNKLHIKCIIWCNISIDWIYENITTIKVVNTYVTFRSFLVAPVLHPSHPSPLNRCFLPSEVVLHFLEFYINGIIQVVLFFSLWLLSPA